MLPPVVFLIIAIIAVGLFALVAIILNGKTHRLDVEEYQTRWLKIKNSLVRGDERSYAFAVMEADKLLDRALRELGIPGKTMGERMKRVGNRFSEVNRVWGAHKIRNQLAHEQDFTVDYETANRALASFRQALKDLGAI